MHSIDLIYFNAGGGHRAAARALEAVIRQRGTPWAVTRTNLFDVLDPGGQFKRLAGIDPEDIYNLRLKKGWTAGLAQELKVFQASIRLLHAPLVQRLQAYWQRRRPDLVVSLIPNFNRALAESVERSLPGVPFLTVMTDLADVPPAFWIEPDTAQHVVCGSARAVAQAQAAGVPAARIHRASGMLLHPDFYEPIALDRARERAALGLDPTRPTGIVMFGGHGSASMKTIAQQLDDRQLVLMCGHNEPLAQALRARVSAAPHAVLGFTSEVRRYLQLGDFFIGKPGPGSLSEAVHLGLPVITFRNAWTMPQERYNTDWVREHGLGRVVPSVKVLRLAVDDLLRDLDAVQARVRQLHNRAVFEVPEVMGQLLAQRAQPAVRRVA